MTSTERHRRWVRKNAAHVREYQTAWRKRNRERVRAYNLKHYKYDPVKARDKGLRRKFGISLTIYDAMRAKQKKGCAICPATKPGGRGTWHVDHDHSTGKVRALLCQNCNIGLGSFKDQPLLLDKAAAYLRGHRK